MNPEKLTKAGVVRESYSLGGLALFGEWLRHGECVEERGIVRERGGSCTCVSHFERSLRNGLHLFSDL